MTTLYDPLLAGIVKIHNHNDIIEGTGFIILKCSEYGLIATCTHVVQAAIQYSPTERVQISFHVGETRLDAFVIYSSPQEMQDLTFLRTTEPLPPYIRSLRLCFTTQRHCQQVLSFGYPKVNGPDGIWGTITRCHAGVKYQNSAALQLKSSEITEGFSGAPVWDDTRQHVIGMVTAIAPPDKYGRMNDVAFALPVDKLWEKVDKLEITFPCPFYAHEPCTRDDKAIFVGDSKTVHLVETHWQQNKSLLAILGPARCGKTSLVQAHLLLLLEDQAYELGQHFGILQLHLTASPFTQFEDYGLSDASLDLSVSIIAWSEQHQYDQVILLFDQFEDFLILASSEMRIQFLDQLVSVLQQQVAKVILVMRDSFYALLAQHRELIRYVEDNLVNAVSPHTKEDLIALAQKQAQSCQVSLHTDLLEEVIVQVQGLFTRDKQMQFSLISLYEMLLADIWHKSHDQSNLTLSDLQLYTFPVSINDRFERIFCELDPHMQNFVQRVCLQLVRSVDYAIKTQGDQILSPYRHHCCALMSLCDDDTQQGLLYKLTEKGVLSISRDPQHSYQEMVMIADDALLHDWQRLHNWLEEEQTFQRWYQPFKEDVHRFYGSPSENRAFLTASALSAAEVLQQTYEHRLTEREKAVIYESRDYLQQQHSAQQQASIAQAHILATQAHTLYKFDSPKTQEALQLAITSHTLFPSAYADQALRYGIQLRPRLIKSFGDGQVMQLVAMSHYGRFAAFMNTIQNCLILIDLSTGSTQARLALHSPVIMSTFHQDETKFGYLCADNTFFIFDVNQFIHIYSGQGTKTTMMLFGPDDRYFVTIQKDAHKKWIEVVDLQQKSVFSLLSRSIILETIVFSPDGNYLAIGRSNNHVCIWNIPEKRVYYHPTHDHSISTLAFSPSGNYLCSASLAGGVIVGKTINHYSRTIDGIEYDQTAIAPDWREWTEIFRRRLTDSIHQARFSHGGTYLALGIIGRRSETKLLSFPDGNEQLSITLSSSIAHLAFSSDDTYLAIACENGVVQIWDLTTRKECKRLLHLAPLRFLVFCLDNHHLFTGSDDQKVRLWDFQHVSPIVHPYASFLSTLTSITSNAQGQNKTCVVAGSDNGSFYVWREEQMYKYQSCIVQPGSVIDRIVLSPAGEYVALSTAQGEVFVFRLSTFQPIVHYQHPGGSLTTLCFNSTGQYLLSTGKDHRVLLYCQQEDMLYSLYNGTRFAYLTFGHDETYLIGATADGYFVLLEYLSPVYNQQLAHQQTDFIHFLVCSNEHSSLITIHNHQACARIWKWDASLHFTKIDVPYEGEVNTAALSANGSLLAMGSTNQMVCIWNTKTGGRNVILPHPGIVEALAFNRDDMHLVTLCTDGNIRVWNVMTGHNIVHFSTSEILPHILFSADDRYIITSTKTGKLTGTCWKPEDLLVIAEGKETEPG